MGNHAGVLNGKYRPTPVVAAMSSERWAVAQCRRPEVITVIARPAHPITSIDGIQSRVQEHRRLASAAESGAGRPGVRRDGRAQL